MKLPTAVGILVILGICGCGEPVERIAETQSGRPEAIFRGMDTETAASRVASMCLQQGLRVDNHTNNQVVCSGQLQGGEAIMAQVLIGNSYSTTPVGRLTYSFIQEGRDVRAYGQGQVSTQMALGQVNSFDTNGNADFNAITQSLLAAGAVLP